MDFVDIILYLMYVSFAVALVSSLWSDFRRKRISGDRLSVQNGIRARMLYVSVWIGILLISLLSFAVGGWNAVDAIVIIMYFVLSIALAATLWSVFKHR